MRFLFSIKCLLAMVLWCAFAAVAATDGRPSSAAMSDPETVRMVGVAWGGYWRKDNSGYYPELVQRIYADANMDVSLRVVPWGRAQRLLETGAADILLGEWGTPKERKLFLHSEATINFETLACLSLKSAPLRCDEAYQRTGRRVAWLKDMEFDEGLPRPVRANVIEVPNSEVGLRMLTHYRIDGFIHYPRAILEDLKKLDAVSEPFTIAGRLDIPVYAVFTRSERGERLKALFDKGYEALVESGWRDSLYPDDIDAVLQALRSNAILAGEAEPSSEEDDE